MGAAEPFFPHVKLIRLQSGSLACVYQDDDADQAPEEREGSGVYRAFSGSVEAAGASESEALALLDRSLLRLSSLPGAPDLAESDSEQLVLAAHDTDHSPSRFRSILPPASGDAQDTVRAPDADTVRAPASLPARAFAGTY